MWPPLGPRWGLAQRVLVVGVPFTALEPGPSVFILWLERVPGLGLRWEEAGLGGMCFLGPRIHC